VASGLWLCRILIRLWAGGAGEAAAR